MPLLPGHRKAAAVTMSALFGAACVAMLGACTPNQPPASAPGTTPAIWTGSPDPAAVHEGSPHRGVTPGPRGVVTHLRAPDGTTVATAKFEFNKGYATIEIVTTAGGELAPGFHGVHIHKVGKCEPHSVAPTGGAPGDFLSAGGHYQSPGRTAEPASGDLTSLEVRKDGTGLLVTTTDAFGLEDLIAGEKTALIIHAGADNFGNIPPDRYTQTNGGTPGPDATTMSTGDAGKRVACGVIGAG